MITDLILTPPPKPPAEPISSSSSVSAPSNSSSSDSPDPTAQTTNFKQALHSARSKQKTTQATASTPAPAKKTAPTATTAIKTKTVATAAPDDEASEAADATATASEEETAEAVAKTTAALPASPQPAKPVAKKSSTSPSETETETATSEKSEITTPSNLVQAITPENQQSPGGKQPKSGAKTAAKSDSTQADVAAVASATLVLTPPANANTDTNQPAVASEKSDPTPAGAIQSGIKPRKTAYVNDSAAQDVDADAATSNAASASASADASIEPPSPDTDPSSVSTPPPSATTPSTPAPASHAVAAITTTLNAVAGVMPAQTTDPTSESPSVSPTRAFAEANQDQIVTTIKGQLLPDGGTMQITLNPANLGHVHISVQVSAGSVSATFETSNDQATRLLSHSLGQLKQTLESAGVTVEKLQVTQTRDPQSSSSQGDSQQSSQQQTATEQRNPQQDQQRQEILQKMWDKIAGADDWIDVKA